MFVLKAARSFRTAPQSDQWFQAPGGPQNLQEPAAHTAGDTSEGRRGGWSEEELVTSCQSVFIWSQTCFWPRRKWTSTWLRVTVWTTSSSAGLPPKTCCKVVFVSFLLFTLFLLLVHTWPLIHQCNHRKVFFSPLVLSPCYFPPFCCCKLHLRPCNHMDSLPTADQTHASCNHLGISSFPLNISGRRNRNVL